MIHLETGAPVPVSQRAALIARGTLRLLEQIGFLGVTEMPLANGRRADIAAIGLKGEFCIIEVKSCLTDFTSDAKWPEYAPFCDRFYFAVDGSFPRDRLPAEAGLIVADGFGGAILRESGLAALAPARRKAMTLRFARLAAARNLRAG